MSFIFGGDTGMTAEDIKQRRAIAARLATQQAAPRNVGEGLTAIGNALAYRGMMKATANAERENKERQAGERATAGARAQDVFGTLFAPTVAADMGAPDTMNPQQPGLPATPPELVPTNKLPDSLIRTESGGNFQAKNDAMGAGGHVGHFGRGQFGVARLDDAKRAGIIPANMTPEDYMAQPGAQERVESWHVGDIQNFIAQSGLDGYVGREINGTVVTPRGMLAVAHLGGKEGLKRYLETGGQYDPADANGTSLTDYLRTHGGGTVPSANPAEVQAVLADPNVDATTKQMILQRFMQMNNPQEGGDRRILDGADGFKYYEDTGERVLPNVQRPQEGPADEYGRYAAEEQAAGREPLSRIDFANAKRGAGTVVYDPATGNPIVQMGGPAGAGKPLTEGQSKDTVYFTRASGALDKLDENDEVLTSYWEDTANMGGALGRKMQSPEYQVAQTAGNEFLQAVLRKDTGAAITQDEQVLYGDTYIPRPGDSPERIAYKREARRRALAAMKAGMPPQAILAAERAMAGPTAAPGMGSPQPAQPSIPPEEKVQLLGRLTESQRQAFQGMTVEQQEAVLRRVQEGMQ